MAVERTLILIKPDATERALSGSSSPGSSGAASRSSAASSSASSAELGKEHYAEHSEKPFFGELVDFHHLRTDLGARRRGRGRDHDDAKTIGATNPADAEPGTIRGDYATSMPNNLIHGSDSPESAEREISLWFAQDELV